MENDSFAYDTYFPIGMAPSTFIELCSRVGRRKTEWIDKDEFLDVIYWSRQICGILLGLTWGIIPLKGLIGIVLYVIINSLAVLVYINVDGIDEDAFGGTWELIKEGFMTSLAGFLVTWIIFYTGLHYEVIMADKLDNIH